MYFCCIRKIFKRFCKCIQYLCLDFFCLDTFERRKGYFWIFLIVSILMYFERWKMLFETLTSWKMNFRWSWLSTFPLTSYFYFNVQKAIFKRELKSTSQGTEVLLHSNVQVKIIYHSNVFLLPNCEKKVLDRPFVSWTFCLKIFLWILLKSEIWLHKRHLTIVQEYAKFHSVWKSPKISHFKLISADFLAKKSSWFQLIF